MPSNDKSVVKDNQNVYRCFYLIMRALPQISLGVEESRGKGEQNSSACPL